MSENTAALEDPQFAVRETPDTFVEGQRIGKLAQPVLMTVQEPNPKLFDRGTNGNGEVVVDSSTVADTPHVYYEPYLLISPEVFNVGVSNFVQSPIMERMGDFGPFKVYRFKTSGHHREDEPSIFGSRKSALRFAAERIPHQTPYTMPEIDRKPKVPETEEAVFKGVPQEERRAMRKELEVLFDEVLINKLAAIKDVKDYPKGLADGLNSICEELFQNAPKDGGGNVITNINDPNWLKWRFAQKYIQPMAKYAGLRSGSIDGTPQEVTDNLTEKIFDYDFVIETMKSQAEILIGEQQKPFHFGFLIPNENLNNVRSGEAGITLTKTHLVVNYGKDAWSFPLPERGADGEVAFKGGIARVIAKIALGIPVADELPPSDVDIVTFGPCKTMTAEMLKEKYKADARDIERIPKGGYTEFLGDRDQAINEVIITSDGLVMSLNALSAYFQSTTEASADPIRNIHGEHVLNVNRGYLTEHPDTSDYFLVQGTRFPSPRALGRMYKMLIEGKVDSITVPSGSLKKDIGAAHWIVLARKMLNIKDPEVRKTNLKRMLEMANAVNSPFFKDEYLNEENGPFKFITSVAKQFRKEAGRDFDLNGELTDKETLDWFSTRLVRQVMNKFDRYFGYNKQKKFENKLTQKDLLPVQIVLPREEHFTKKYWAETRRLTPRQEKVEGEDELDWRKVNLEEVMANPLYAELFKREEERQERLNRADLISNEEWERVKIEIGREATADENEILATDREKWEYRNWYVKFVDLEQMKNSYDPGIYPVLQQFNRLPFWSRSSCTGHVFPGTEMLEENSVLALSFAAHTDSTENEKVVQRHFIYGIDSLNAKICSRLGVERQNILTLEGDYQGSDETGFIYFNVNESFKLGLNVNVAINVSDYHLRNERGKEVLSTIWEEMYKYIDSYLPEHSEPPDFGDGDIFEK